MFDSLIYSDLSYVPSSLDGDGDTFQRATYLKKDIDKHLMQIQIGDTYTAPNSQFLKILQYFRSAIVSKI